MRAHLILAIALPGLLSALSPAQSPRDSGPVTTDGSPMQSDSASTTVSVPIHDGDPATVTGMLALHTRAGKQFLVIESPTPYRLVPPSGALGAKAKVIRDIAFNLPGQQAAILPFVGRTVTATGKLHIESKSAASWTAPCSKAASSSFPAVNNCTRSTKFPRKLSELAAMTYLPTHRTR